MDLPCPENEILQQVTFIGVALAMLEQREALPIALRRASLCDADPSPRDVLRPNESPVAASDDIREGVLLRELSHSI